MYDELVKRLRETSCGAENTLWWQASDAIEELQADKAALNDTVTNLLEQIKDLGKPRWIPVTERLPKDHERVLVVNDDGKMMVAQRAEDDWWHYYCAYDVDRWWTGENGEIVAWMPLPEPPKEET